MDSQTTDSSASQPTLTQTMLPWAHAALGYLLYSGWCHLRHGRPPAAVPALVLGVGTQLPDLIDKTFSWTVPLLPSGRSLAHSLLVFVLVLVGLRIVVARIGHYREIGAFAGGWASHLLGDAFGAIISGDFSYLTYLLWPAVPIPETEHSMSFLEFFLALELTPSMWFGFILTGVGLVQWWRDDMPGLQFLVGLVTRSPDKSV